MPAQNIFPFSSVALWYLSGFSGTIKDNYFLGGSLYAGVFYLYGAVQR
jgi:hypothetical protein